MTNSLLFIITTISQMLGFLFDITHSWEQSFLQAALWIVISGILILGISFTKNRKIIGSGPLEMEKVSETGSIA